MKWSHVMFQYLMAECKCIDSGTQLTSSLRRDIEQRGTYEVPDDQSVFCVIPLWCAAVSGHIAVVKCLISHGADVNTESNSGSTAVRSACFITHMGKVSFAV